jgi:DNA (cytosine-5)-methyltransferase 1
MEIKHLELFAGIGGFRRAIDVLASDFGINAKCIGFSEIDHYAVRTYKANFNTKDEVELGDIEKFTSLEEKIEQLPDFDLLTGGFPCQSFSMMGQQKGFDDERGNLFYHIANILEVKKPRFVLLENVKNLLSHDNGETFKEIINTLEKVGYARENIYFDVFNTRDFGLAQTRNRVFIFASREKLPFGFHFSKAYIKAAFQPLNGETTIDRQGSVLDVLAQKVDSKYYLSERIKPTILANGSKNFQSKSEINQLIARPLTATMVKMHRACQDNYYSDAFLKAENPVNYSKIAFSKEQLQTHPIRKITPEEAFRLQGFKSDFFEKAEKAGLSDHQLYKQAGNAVSVNTVYAILYYLFVKHNLLQNERLCNTLQPSC